MLNTRRMHLIMKSDICEKRRMRYSNFSYDLCTEESPTVMKHLQTSGNPFHVWNDVCFISSHPQYFVPFVVPFDKSDEDIDGFVLALGLVQWANAFFMAGYPRLPYPGRTPPIVFVSRDCVAPVPCSYPATCNAGT